MSLARTLIAALAAGATLAVGVGLAGAPAGAATGGLAYGITAHGRLVLFDLDDPSAPPLESADVVGMASGEAITALDVDAPGAPLLALAVAPSGSAHLYSLDTDPVDGEFGVATEVAEVATPLTGGEHDIDVDGCTGDVRVVGTNGANVRLTGAARATTVVETSLAYAAGDSGAGRPPRVAAVAVTPGSTPEPGADCTPATYAIDISRDVLATHAGASGTLATVGPLGVDVTSLIGFDVASDGTAYVGALVTDPEGVQGTRTEVFTADLATGTLTRVGGVDAEILRSMAVVPLDDETGVPALPLVWAAPAVGAVAIALEVSRTRRRPS